MQLEALITPAPSELGMSVSASRYMAFDVRACTCPQECCKCKVALIFTTVDSHCAHWWAGQQALRLKANRVRQPKRPSWLGSRCVLSHSLYLKLMHATSWLYVCQPVVDTFDMPFYI